MSHLHNIYQRLRSIEDDSVDLAMGAALPTADPLAVKLIVLSLLDRQQHQGQAALVEHYDRLPPDLQHTVVRNVGQLYRPLREVAGQKSVAGPSNVVRIVVAAKAAGLAYLVAEQLHHRPPALRLQAAQGLLELARWASTAIGAHHDPKYVCDAASAKYIMAAVEEGVRRYHTHTQPEVIAAMLALVPRAMGETFKNLEDPRHPAVDVLGKYLKAAGDTDTRRALLVMIRVPTLTAAAVTGLMSAAEYGALGDVMANAHLMLSPGVSKALSKVDSPDKLWPSMDDVAGWTPHQTRGLAPWVMALSYDRNQRVERLAQLQKLSDPMSRLSVLRRLIAISSVGDGASADQVISGFCFDPEPKLAWIAARYLISCDWKGVSKLLPRLINSGHAEIAQLARQRLAPLGFGRLWAGWVEMSPEKRLSVGRALIKIDPLFHSHLSQKLNSPDRDDLLRAVSIIHGLNQAAFFESELLSMAHADDEVVVSAAVRALGATGSTTAVETLEKALGHSDSRVRANAVEALDQTRSTRHVQQLFEMAQHDQARPRANAIKALMQMNAGDALKTLAIMLDDTRPAQRTSALWVVEALGLVDVARHVAEMSITDPDQDVKKRADHVIHGLIHLMDTQGTGHAA